MFGNTVNMISLGMCPLHRHQWLEVFQNGGPEGDEKFECICFEKWCMVDATCGQDFRFNLFLPELHERHEWIQCGRSHRHRLP